MSLLSVPKLTGDSLHTQDR